MMVKEAASATVDALKTQPLALALVVVNLIFLFGGAFLLRDVGARIERREKMMMDFVQTQCAEKK